MSSKPKSSSESARFTEAMREMLKVTPEQLRQAEAKKRKHASSKRPSQSKPKS